MSILLARCNDKMAELEGIYHGWLSQQWEDCDSYPNLEFSFVVVNGTRPDFMEIKKNNAVGTHT